MQPNQKARKKTHEVFGVSNTVLADSYVDRGNLDEDIAKLLSRSVHVALRGVSKCGKSWLRQTVLPDAIVVQCRLGKSIADIYRETLGTLGIRLEVNKVSESALKGTVEATGELGIKLIAKVKAKLGLEYTGGSKTTSEPISQNVDDLRFVAELILESERRLVIEDFHYLSMAERRKFAFDLKALWDFGVFVVIVGVWSKQNMLLHLNSDLTARVHETSIVWTDDDLKKILKRGGTALGIEFSDPFVSSAVADCYGNAGILQTLALGALDEAKITEERSPAIEFNNSGNLLDACLFYADQLNPLYQQFADRVSRGIRIRQNATGIYAHAMAVILKAPDRDLLNGFSLDYIYSEASRRESRIQKSNLRTVLGRIESLQVDEDGRGLILAYNETTKEVTVVDRQVLLYRKYSTVGWPWEDLISDIDARGQLRFDIDEA
ncbi:hypothetical protein [Crossiella sp. NPDC003009]